MSNTEYIKLRNRFIKAFPILKKELDYEVNDVKKDLLSRLKKAKKQGNTWMINRIKKELEENRVLMEFKTPLGRVIQCFIDNKCKPSRRYKKRHRFYFDIFIWDRNMKYYEEVKYIFERLGFKKVRCRTYARYGGAEGCMYNMPSLIDIKYRLFKIIKEKSKKRTSERKITDDEIIHAFEKIVEHINKINESIRKLKNDIKKIDKDSSANEWMKYYRAIL